MKQLGISIIGTDTDVGKTFVTGLLGAMAVDDGFAGIAYRYRFN